MIPFNKIKEIYMCVLKYGDSIAIYNSPIISLQYDVSAQSRGIQYLIENKWVDGGTNII